MFFHRGRNLDDSYCGTQPEHRFIIFTSASQISILLSSPSLILSRHLDTSPIFPPSLPPLVRGGSSFLSFFFIFPLLFTHLASAAAPFSLSSSPSAPFPHHLSPSSHPSSPLPLTSSAAVVYIHIAPATTC